MSRSRFACPALVTLLALPSAAQTVRPAQRINVGGSNVANNNQSDGIGLAVQGSRFVMVWCEQFGTAAATQDAFVSVSNDDGLTWSAPLRIDTGDPPNQSDTEESKVVITANGTIVAIFEDKKDATLAGSNNEDLFYNRSTDGGVTWMAAALPLNVATSGAHVTSDIDRASVAVSGDSVHVIWEEDSLTALGGAEEMWYTRSDDAGANWTTPVVLTPSTSPASDIDDPKIVAAGSNVVIVGILDTLGTDDAYAWSSSNGGQTFAMQSVESSVFGDVNGPLAAMDGDLVALGWLDNDNLFPGGYGMHVVTSLDGGQSFGTESSISVRVEATQFSNAIWAGLAARGDDVYAVTADDSESVLAGGATGQAGAKVYAAASNDSGGTWSVDIPLDPGDPRRNNRPAVVASDFQVFVHMETGTDGGNGLAYLVSNDFGHTWTPPLLVPNIGPDVDTEDPHEGAFFAVGEASVALSGFWDRPTGANELYVSGVEGGFGPIGTSYCSPALPNSSGSPAHIAAFGSIFAGGNPLTLAAETLPSNQFGYFLAGRVQGLFNPPGSQGLICLSGNIGRYNAPSQIRFSGPTGEFQLAVDTNAIPVNPTAAALAGESWSFQAWFRDNNPTLTSNFTDGVEIVFQ